MNEIQVTGVVAESDKPVISGARQPGVALGCEEAARAVIGRPTAARYTLIALLLPLCGIVAMPQDAMAAAAARDTPQERVVMGWLESVFFRPWNVRMTAKLDTGANTSSLHAERIERFSRDGRKWVRFTLVKNEDKKFVVERPVVRTANIKQHGKGSAQREVVMMVLCKNGREYDTEFTLVDRSNFSYPVLLGRSFLKNSVLVDASETFLFKAERDPCKRGAAD